MLANLPVVGFVHIDDENGRIQTTLKLFAIICLVGIFIWFHEPILDVLKVVGDREAVALYLEKFGIFAPLLLGFILMLQVVVAAIPGHALVVGGGYVFGFWPAFWISLITTVIGSQLGFLLARWAGRPLVEKLAPVDVLDKWNEVSAQKGLLFFMVAFMLPIFPADVMTYIAGLSSLSTRRFFVANLIGRTPGVVVMTAVGAYGFQLSPSILIGIAVVGGLMFVGWRVFFAAEQAS